MGGKLRTAGVQGSLRGQMSRKKREVWRLGAYCGACPGSVPMGADPFYDRILLQEANGMGGNTFTRACEAQLFLGGSLDADLIHVNPEGGGDVLSHSEDMGG